MSKLIVKLENEITILENEAMEYQKLFQDPDFMSRQALVKQKQSEYKDLQSKINTKTVEWEESLKALEILTKND